MKNRNVPFFLFQKCWRESPRPTFEELSVPEGNSITRIAFQQTPLKLNGLRQDIILITLYFLSIKITSIENRIKKVCTVLHGLMINALPF